MLRRVLPLLLAACAPIDTTIAPPDDAGPDADTVDLLPDTDASPASGCATHVAWISPEASTAHVPVDTVVHVGFDAPVPVDADWSLTIDGVPGTVEVSSDGRLATFTPDAPLSHDDDFLVEVSVCGDTEQASFRTIGAPIDPDVLVGRTWHVEAEVSWVTPVGVPTLLSLLDVPDLIAHVEEGPDGLHLQARFAISVDGHLFPVPCAPVVDLGRLDLTGNPRFTTAPSSFDFGWQSTRLSADDVHIEGVVEDDGRRLEALSFRGELDVRPLEALTGVTGLCAPAGGLGIACQPCDDGVASCFPALVTDGSADEWSGVAFDSDPFDFLGVCP